MNKTNFLILVLTLAFFLCAASCSRGEDIFDFADHDATFSLVFPSGLGDITLDCSGGKGSVLATVQSPDRICGIEILYSNGCVSISAEGTVVPLSNEAAREYCRIFDVMFRGEDGAEVTKSEDGEYTLVRYSDGTITLDGDGVPTEIDVGRTVRITNYLAED